MADEKKVNVKGEADVSGDVEGKLEVEADVKFTQGEAAPNPEAEFISDLGALFEKYSEATKGAGRETAKASVPTPPNAFSRSGGVD